MATNDQEVEGIIVELKSAAIGLQDPELMRSIQRLEEIMTFRARRQGDQ